MNDNTLALLRSCLLTVLLPFGAAMAAPPAGLSLAFEELWEPRTAATAVLGVLSSDPLRQTPDKSDPQQAWSASTVWGKWGTLRTMDGSVPGLPNVTGLGPNPHWMVRDGRLHFHAARATGEGGQATDGFALISKQAFPRNRRIVVEGDLSLAKGSEGAFVGLTLIAGEGDYRELAIYRRAAGGKDTHDTIDRVTPLQANVLAKRTTDVTTLRIEYDPVSGFRYFANGKLIGTEALDASGGHFSADPNVGLYFTATPAVKDGFVEGSVGPLRVWVDAAPPVASAGAGPQ